MGFFARERGGGGAEKDFWVDDGKFVKGVVCL